MGRVISVFFAILLVCCIPLTARADTGPKPSVHVTLENLEDVTCYATLLSSTESTGPASVWDGEEDHIYSNFENMDVLRAFADYKDPDGFYFLQWAWEVTESKEFTWGYYPPDTFKVLLYYPETGTFAVSQICERFAFHSYFVVDMRGAGLVANENHEDSSDAENFDPYPIEDEDDYGLIAVKDYDFSLEIISLICRIVICLILEMLVAFLFRFREKKTYGLIAVTNLVTQIALNVVLNLINYKQGPLMTVLIYIQLELVVLVGEAVFYALVLPKNGGEWVSRKKAVAYAIAANIVSFVAGLGIAQAIPNIF